MKTKGRGGDARPLSQIRRQHSYTSTASRSTKRSDEQSLTFRRLGEKDVSLRPLSPSLSREAPQLLADRQRDALVARSLVGASPKQSPWRRASHRSNGTAVGLPSTRQSPSPPFDTQIQTSQVQGQVQDHADVRPQAAVPGVSLLCRPVSIDREKPRPPSLAPCLALTPFLLLPATQAIPAGSPCPRTPPSRPWSASPPRSSRCPRPPRRSSQRTASASTRRRRRVRRRGGGAE